MKNNQDFKIKIESEYADKVLKEAGYCEHTTIHNKKEKEGYVKYEFGKKRFHAFILDNVVSLHVDKTVKGKHVVMNGYYLKFLSKECKRIKKIYRKHNPIIKPVSKREKRKSKYKSQFAPNVIELQRNFKPKIIKPSIFARIKSLFI